MERDNKRFLEAFPPELASDVQVVARLLTPSDHPTHEHDIGPIEIDKHPVRIPARIYAHPPNATAASTLTDRQRIVLGCLLTRHHDGYVRERALRGVVQWIEPWVVPFVVQLIGEYVVQILEVLDDGMRETHRDVYGAFVKHNPDFFELTRQHVASYWDCYFRAAGSPREDHVGFRLLRRLEGWRDARHPIPPPNERCSRRALALRN